METNDKITLIIPLRLTGATHEVEARLSRICGMVPRDLFDILISDYGTPAEHRGPLDALAAEGIRIVSHPAPHRLFSIGRARDHGVQMSRAPVIVFNDIDFLGTEAMYRAIHAEAVRRNMAANLFDFFCVPVLFLTEEGTREWLSAEDGRKPFAGPLAVADLEADRVRIQSAAYGSSAMVVNRHHYLALGGHDPRFTGHGAEDYDLLHRLATLAPKGPRPHDYHSDYKDNNARHYWGFRPFFALYGLDLLPHGIHLVHLWHPRRREKGYFRPGRNFRLLKRVMKRFDRAGIQPPPLAHAEGGAGRWLVVYRTGRDLDLLRQILPMSASYRLLKARSPADAARKLEAAGRAGIDRFLVAPGVSGDVALLEARIPPDIPCLTMGAPDADGVVTFRDRRGDTVASGAVRWLRAPAGRPVMASWRDLSLPGLPRLASGVIPSQQDAGAPLFESFGREQVLVGDRKSRPAKKKKSPALIRFRRWLTGY